VAQVVQLLHLPYHLELLVYKVQQELQYLELEAQVVQVVQEPSYYLQYSHQV
jgi:hypothetical protein